MVIYPIPTCVLEYGKGTGMGQDEARGGIPSYCGIQAAIHGMNRDEAERGGSASGRSPTCGFVNPGFLSGEPSPSPQSA